MTSRFGCSTISALLTVAALSAVGVAGYASFTGKTICSMVHGCPGETTEAVAAAPAKAIPVSAAEGEKPCCAMSKLAKAKSAAKLIGADAKAMCSKTMTVHARSLNAVVLGATYPVAVPAAFYDNTAAMDDAKLVGSGCCPSGAAKSNKMECTSKATMINASATSEPASGCCSAKKAAVINAAATTEKSDSGCCKGSGQRADGKACCGGCKDKATTTKAAEPIAEKPATDAANPS